MKKYFDKFKLWFASILKCIASWLENAEISQNTNSKFVDLAPTDEADEQGIYSSAIQFAIDNEKVMNIALTGPYGSGKSSIIQSFLKKYSKPVLRISLAAFVSETEQPNKAERQEIERSILQQMLYGADANRLPLSRFKRIQSPGGWSVIKSLAIVLGTLSIWYVFNQRENIISGSYFKPLTLSNWFNFGVISCSALFLWAVFHRFYVASFGLSLKGISLKDVEIKPSNNDETSILNRHLDEIVYFFQSTQYDLVIIEDLDRFDKPDIFVTLREINSLVNENAGVTRTIRFLYALRDDMFANTERTKFFEFIIPVIPIINSSNSIDMVLKQGHRLELENRLERQFLREVSRYLNDLRLIQNIFNEYAVYISSLENNDDEILDANKLLAILIYKNVYPKDFEELHQGTGNLAELLNCKSEIITDCEDRLRRKLNVLEKRLEIAEQQIAIDVKELNQIYAMALFELMGNNVRYVVLDGRNSIEVCTIADNDNFEQVIEHNKIEVINFNGHRHTVNISGVQNSVNDYKSYKQRKKEIDDRSAAGKNKLLSQIYDLKLKINALRTTKLKALLRLDLEKSEALFEKFGENGELARYLILEGYLDDTYYQYTSLFHSGRLSPNDNKFLIQIRAFKTPEPQYPIDNPKEVIEAMRKEDFGQSFILNVKLVDTILNEPGRYKCKLLKIIEFVSSTFDSCEEFLEVYYSSGRNTNKLISQLEEHWDYLTATALSSENSISHVTQILLHVPKSRLKRLTLNFEELPKFVSDNLPEILGRCPELEPETITCLNVEALDFSAINDHADIVRAMFKEGLFALTIDNLEFIYLEILGESDVEQLRKRNLTTLLSIKNETLLLRIERDFKKYLNNILLELSENNQETPDSIVKVMCQEEIDESDLKRFLEKQNTLLPNLETIPEKLHSMLFDLGKVEPKWGNCLSFIKSDEFNEESLLNYLDRDTVRESILIHPMPTDEASKPLRNFIISANSLSFDAYKDYAKALPLSFTKPPEGLSSDKLSVLIRERKIRLSKESIDAFYEDEDLQVQLVVENITSYLSEPDIYSLDDDFRELLLRTELDKTYKLEIVRLINLETVISDPDRALLIGPILLNSESYNDIELNEDIVQSLILNCSPVSIQISLFNRYQSLLDDYTVREILTKLPKPYCDIKTGYKQPKLKKTAENISLAGWLKSRNLISSISDSERYNDNIVINLYRS
ncbi:ATP-binding protein [Pseudoalteromonas sp. CnMc7-15]|uniref:YobI family P-loop NTPase n=1 Tax=unclassified Pseudoalteromonas TaxID=194690 RepID=UPI001EF63E65|nr:P-loop NTPase fold protein [Pseudoalteromonas sp. CnMc7-15]MCG7565154.1 ATP-binding protein [Pseudoalteromonas sp. CnMc7-15]